MTDSLTIAYFTHFTGRLLGGERALVDLLNSFEREYRVIIFARQNGERLRSYLKRPEQTEIYDVDYHCYPYTIIANQDIEISPWRYARFMRWYLTQNLRRLKRVRSLLSQHQVDLVHTITSAVDMGALYAITARKPHVWHAQETIAYKRLSQRVWLTYMHFASDIIVAISERTARDYGPKTVVINNGIQVDQILADYGTADAEALRCEYGLRDNDIVLFCIGTLQAGKGQDLLVKALTLLQHQAPEQHYRLFLVGSIISDPRYAAYADQLQQDIERYGLADRVHLTGYRADYLAFMKLATICVHPATLDDSYPAAVRDPMLCGKPVIGTRTGGIPEMINDGVTGLLVEPNDAVSLAAAIRCLVESVTLRETLSENARAFAVEHFDARRMAAQIEALYERLLNGQR